MKLPHAERNCIGFRETDFQKAKEERQKEIEKREKIKGGERNMQYT